MYYLALACDYDGTLAHEGQVSQQTIAALDRVVASGRHLLLISGRLLEDLQRVFPHLDLFAYVVAENGALLYHPASGKQTLLAEPPPARFLQVLRDRGVTPLVTGKVIVATLTPHDTTVVNVIHELGLKLQVIFNKGAVMVLPAGIDKSTGLLAAAQALQLSPQDVVGVGDAENDRSFLTHCGYSVAVANALPALKELADYTTQASDGDGVVELVERLLADDLLKITYEK
jgi:hydroxymethylpyrimidine pyrophosphatase-like HAD family hydrolase